MTGDKGRTDYFREVAHAQTADAGKVPAHGMKATQEGTS